MAPSLVVVPTAEYFPNLNTGACLHSLCPEDYGNDVDRRREACIGLFIARGDTSKRLDGAEEVFDEVPPVASENSIRWSGDC